MTTVDEWLSFITDRCVELAAEGAAAGSDTRGGATTELQARLIALRADVIAGAPAPKWWRSAALKRIATRHWPDHPDLPEGNTP